MRKIIFTFYDLELLLCKHLTSYKLVLHEKFYRMDDIQNRIDMELLVNNFYERVHNEPNLAPVFEMPAEHWDMHITRVVNFWENWLFQTGSYNGGMIWVHLQANEKHRLTTERFEQWLALWFLTTDSLFAGENADFVKSKALEIGQIMNAKFNDQ
jgi:hemoglobin